MWVAESNSVMEAVIRNSQGERLDYTYQAGKAETYKQDVLVVLGHGVTGNKDRPVVADTAAALSGAGFDTLLVSFSGNGDSEGRFQDSTISKEVDDLGSVLDAVHRDGLKIVYIGHSMGGAVGVLRASKDARITALISLAGMVDTKLFAETEFGEEEPDKGLMWEEPDCPLSSTFMNDLCEKVVSVKAQAATLALPWMLVHGTADDVVLPADTKSIQALGLANTSVTFVDGADHSFNEPAHKAAMIQAVLSWIETAV